MASSSGDTYQPSGSYGTSFSNWIDKKVTLSDVLNHSYRTSRLKCRGSQNMGMAPGRPGFPGWITVGFRKQGARLIQDLSW